MLKKWCIALGFGLVLLTSGCSFGESSNGDWHAEEEDEREEERQQEEDEEEESEREAEEDFEEETEEETEAEQGHKHKIKGKKKITVDNSLKVGDIVLIAREQGGQRFIVIDKAVGL